MATDPSPPRQSVSLGLMVFIVVVLMAVALGVIYKSRRAEAAQFPGFISEGNASETHRTWTVHQPGIEMVLIGPGQFTMGSAAAGPPETPVTQVTISAAFWLGKTAVTKAQWKAVMGTAETGQAERTKSTGSSLAERLEQAANPPPKTFWDKLGNVVAIVYDPSKNDPVSNVSWDAATEFCRRLTNGEQAAGRLPNGCAFTLPTEAQREYACRAGTTGDYPGDLDAMSWYIKNSSHTLHPVGLKEPNPWGLYDMNGDMWEWCRDWFGNYPGGSVTDPTGPSSGSLRAFRGGNWTSEAAECRSSSRGGIAPTARTGALSFRVALVQAGK